MFEGIVYILTGAGIAAVFFWAGMSLANKGEIRKPEIQLPKRKKRGDAVILKSKTEEEKEIEKEEAALAGS